MPSSSEIRAGKAYVEVTAKDSTAQQLNRIAANVESFGKRLSSIGKGLSFAGAAITAPLIAAAKLSADAGAKLYDMSKRTGVAASKLSAFGYAADQTGASIDNVETGIKLMQKSIARLAADNAAPMTVAKLRKEITDAAAAADGAVGDLGDLGVTMNDLRGKNPGEQFEIIAGKIAAIKDPTSRAAAALKVFGRSGTELLPMIERLGELQEEAKRFGFVRSDASAAAAKQMSVAFDLVTKSAKSLWSNLSTALYPTLQAKAQVMFRATLLARDWAKSHQEIVVTAFKVGAALVVAGAGMLAVGKALTITAPLLRMIGPAFGLLGTAMGALVSPLGLVAGALVAAGAAFLYFSGVGAKAMEFISQSLPGLSEDMNTALGGIADALKSGDLSQAARIGAAMLAIVWVDLKAYAMDVFNEIGNVMVAQMIKASAKVQEIWVRMKGALKALASDNGNTWAIILKQQEVAQAQAELDGAKRRKESPETIKHLNQIVLDKNQELKDTIHIGEADVNSVSPETQAQIDAITKKRDADLDALQSITDGDADRRRGLLQETIADAEAQLKKLREQAAEDAERGGHKYDLPTDFPDLPNPQDLSDSIATAAAKAFGSRGTFNTTGTQGLQGFGAFDRTAKATEQTAKNTADLVRSFRSGGSFAINYQP